MNTFLRAVTLSGGMLLCSLASAQSSPSSQSNMRSMDPPANQSEAAQLSQDMSPQARSQLARREAYAAYNEALSACKSMDRAERKGCAAEAKRYLQQDLSYAKALRTQDTSVGSSGVRESSSSSSSGISNSSSSSSSSGISSSSSSSGSPSSASSASSPINGSGMSSGGSSSSDVSGSNGSSGMSGMGGRSSTSDTGSTGSTSSTSGTSGASTMGRPDLSQGDLQNDRPAPDISSGNLSSAEKKQFVQSFTPQAQYNLSKREAHAAYAEALKACKAMAKSERTACTKEARSTLQQDLAYAKSQLQQESSGASSGGSTESGVSGSGR